MGTFIFSQRMGRYWLGLFVAAVNLAHADPIVHPGWHNVAPARLPVVNGTNTMAGAAKENAPKNVRAKATAAAATTNADTPVTATAPWGTPIVYAGAAAAAITPELQALATALDNDPVKIFNYVHGHIEFQPYYGSHKGAHLTYIDQAGNDMDQASLLIALLRQAGFPSASYVYGQYTVPDTSADGFNLSNWLGTTPALAPYLLAYAGIPIENGTPGGKNTTWPFDHVWVRVTIKGAIYDLDPSYKQHQVNSPIDYQTASGYSRSELLADAGGTAASNYVQNLNRARVESRLAQYTANLVSVLKANYPNAETEQILGGGHILDHPIAALAQGAPPPAFQPTVWNVFDALPPEYKATYQIQFKTDVGNSLDVTFNVDSLQGNRLSLVFVGGNAQLWLGDTLVAQEAHAASLSADMTVTVTQPADSAGTSFPMTFSRDGSYDLTYSFYGNPRSSGPIDASNRRLQNYLASGLASDSSAVVTETLHSLGLKWARQVGLQSELVAKTLGVCCVLHQICGRAGQQSGYYVDMPGISITMGDTSGLNTTAFNSSGFIGSAMEHGVIEQNGGSAAVSTIKCLTLANDAGQKIFLANLANFKRVVAPQLTGYSYDTLNYLRSYVLNGYSLLLPENGQLRVNQWQGFGFAALNGEWAAMMIDGGYYGGHSTTLDPLDTELQNWLNQSMSTQSTQISNLPAVKSNEPVNLLTGAYTMEHADLTLGESSSPRGLNFTRYYDSSRNFQSSALGNGWRHSCEGRIVLSSELDNAFGLTQPQDAAQTIVGIMVVNDLMNASSDAQELMLGTLAANWTVNRILHNAANVQLGDERPTYVSQPDGSWTPPPGSTTALVGASGSFKLLPRFGGSITFNAQNLLDQATDVDGNKQTYAYDTKGRLSTVTDQYHRTLTFTYNPSDPGAGLLQQVQDSTGRSVKFTYTGGTFSGANLTGITDPEQYQKTFVYDSRNRLTDLKDNSQAALAHNDYDLLDRVYRQLGQGLATHAWQFHYSLGVTYEIDPQGDETAHLFDHKNRNVGTIDALGHGSALGYDGQNHVTSAVDATLRRATFQYDGNQNLITSTDNAGQITTYQYDNLFRLWKITDATGKTTTNGYDAKNHLISITDPGSRQTQYFYRSDGLLDHTIDAANKTTSLSAYDGYGNPTSITRADGTTSSATYNARGDLLNSTDGRGQTTTFTYDNRRLLKTRVDALQNTTKWEYDSNGYPASVTDRNGHITTFAFDNLGHPISTQAPDTAPVTSGYDERGWLTSVTDGLGHAVTFGHDPAGRSTSITNALSIAVTQLVYDDAGRLSAQKDGLLHSTKFSYDAAGRLESSQDPLNHDTHHAYDAAGRPLSFTDRRGHSFDFGYASDGLANAFTYPSARQTKIVDRDPRGLPQTLQSPSGQQSVLTYDAMGRTKKRVDAVGTITVNYDNEGNATDVIEATGATRATIHRVFDELGRVTSVTDSQGFTVGYSYDNEGNISTITYPGGKAVNYMYDGSNRLKRVTDWTGRVTNYTYDRAGRLQTVERPNGTRQRVTLDVANRLTGSYEELMNGDTVVSTLWQASYGYDNANRLTSFSPTPMAKPLAPSTATQTFDEDNQLATYNAQAVSHDLDGNLQSAPVQGTVLGGLTWDKRNRLLNAGGVGYAYDAENRRISSTTGGQTTRYVYSRGALLDRLLVKQNADGSLTRYVYGTGLLYEVSADATGADAGPVFYHFDWRGDTIALSNANGNVTARLSYSPYGERTIESGTVTTPFCYNGRWGVMTEATGLLSMQARFYSPVLLRFLNEDPSGFLGGSNMYAYANGDPIDNMDPFGLWSMTQTWGGVRAAGGFLEALAGAGFGAATSWTGIGAVAGGAVALHGMDQALAGFRQMMSGQATDSLTSTGLQGLGMSKNAANLTDAGISVVGSLGAGIGTAGVRAAQIAATDPLAQGMSTWKILTQWEKGSVALTTEDFSALGGLETSPLAKAQMMAAGVNAAGETFSTSTNFLQEIAIGTKLIGTGLTPIGYLGSGVLGAGAAAAAGAHAHGK